jgi:hypothetical protein
MHVRLTRKFAEVLNGLDLSTFRVGDVMELSTPMGTMLLDEGWAEPAPSPEPRNRSASHPTPTNE